MAAYTQVLSFNIYNFFYFLVMMDDALSIYRHFISLDATQPLGVDENIRREVESNICTENGVIDPECFNVAQKFAFNTLQNRSVLQKETAGKDGSCSIAKKDI